MQDVPLSVRTLFDYGRRIFPASRVETYDGERLVARPFGDVAAAAVRLANGLRRLGVRPGDRVATFCWNHARHLEAYFAVPCMGAVLHTVNIRLSPEQIAYVVNHAADSVLIVDEELLPLLEPALAALETVRHIVVIGAPSVSFAGEVLAFDALVQGGGDAEDWPVVPETAASAMCYTSGTTGNPKGVVYSHRSTVLHSLAQTGANVYALGDRDRILVAVPMFHANAWGLPYTGWLVGADLIFPRRYMQPEHLVRLIEEGRPTFSAGVPTVWNDLLRHLDGRPARLDSLRAVVLGGAAAPVSLMQRFEERYGVRIIQGYGMTETSPLVALSWPPRDANPADSLRYRARTGRPIPGVELRIVDDAGRVQPWDDAAAGEIELRGPWIAAGYHRDAESDRMHDGWLRTGDVGRIDPAGYLQITDRAKDVIKSGGEWISSVDLENALASHPDVVEAAVIGVADERWQERPLACVVCADPAAADPARLLQHLRGKVARWWLPERWCFLPQIPKTTVGKYDKRRLREMHGAGELPVLQLAPEVDAAR